MVVVDCAILCRERRQSRVGKQKTSRTFGYAEARSRQPDGAWRTCNAEWRQMRRAPGSPPKSGVPEEASESRREALCVRSRPPRPEETKDTS